MLGSCASPHWRVSLGKYLLTDALPIYCPHIRAKYTDMNRQKRPRDNSPMLTFEGQSKNVIYLLVYT